MSHENPYNAPRASLGVELKPLQFDGFNNLSRYVASFFCAASILLGLYSLWVTTSPYSFFQSLSVSVIAIFLVTLANAFNVLFLLRFAQFGRHTTLAILSNSVCLLLLGELLMQFFPSFASFRTGFFLAFFVLIPCALTLCIAIMSRNAYKKLAR
jgi:hypothetical protein